MANPFQDDMTDEDNDEGTLTGTTHKPQRRQQSPSRGANHQNIQETSTSALVVGATAESSSLSLKETTSSPSPSKASISEPSEIKEGLICPECVSEFATINGLQEHFQAAHANLADGSGFTALLGAQWKGLMTKAKKKILKNGVSLGDDQSDTNSSSSSSGTLQNGPLGDLNQEARNYVAEFRDAIGANQQPGRSKSHWKQFKSIRDGRIERTVMETNKLLIRLDKLVTDPPTDPDRRKAHEKSVVPWACDDDVRLCPSCAKTFNLSRRRHHCRLCGAIMCHNCSNFLEHDLAHRLVGPTPLDSTTPLRASTPCQSPSHGAANNPSATNPNPSSAVSSNTQLNKALALIPSIGKRGSAQSLLALVNGVTGQSLTAGSGSAQEMWPQIRLCTDCMRLIDRRIDQIDERLARPPICKMYQDMKQCMAEAEKLAPIYTKMAVSLSIGESDYNWRDAFDLRVKVMRLAERIDLYSKKIAVLGAKDDPPPNRKQVQLQGRVRNAVTAFLKDKLVALPSLPTEPEVLKLQEKRRQDIRKQMEAERMAQAAMSLGHNRSASSGGSKPPRSHSKSPSPSATRNGSLSVSEISHESGWGTEQRLPPQIKAAVSNPVSDTEVDPMLLQINIIRGYIDQARDAHKYDEVRMLEENLKELEIEYLVQEQQNQHQAKAAQAAAAQAAAQAASLSRQVEQQNVEIIEPTNQSNPTSPASNI